MVWAVDSSTVSPRPTPFFHSIPASSVNGSTYCCHQKMPRRVVPADNAPPPAEISQLPVHSTPPPRRAGRSLLSMTEQVAVNSSKARLRPSTRATLASLLSMTEPASEAAAGPMDGGGLVVSAGGPSVSLDERPCRGHLPAPGTTYSPAQGVQYPMPGSFAADETSYPETSYSEAGDEAQAPLCVPFAMRQRASRSGLKAKVQAMDELDQALDQARKLDAQDQARKLRAQDAFRHWMGAARLCAHRRSWETLLNFRLAAQAEQHEALMGEERERSWCAAQVRPACGSSP